MTIVIPEAVITIVGMSLIFLIPFFINQIQKYRELKWRYDNLKEDKYRLEGNLETVERDLEEANRRLNSLGILEEIRNLIHRENGPAIYLRDNQVAYFWEGIHVPEHVVMAPEKITPDEVIAADNIEYRRILLERMGIGNFITQIGGEEGQKDKWGTLWEVWRDDAAKQLFPDGRTNSRENEILDRIFGTTSLTKFVQVKDSSTDRMYFLQVPSTIQTAKQAIAWSFKLKEEEYSPRKET